MNTQDVPEPPQHDETLRHNLAELVRRLKENPDSQPGRHPSMVAYESGYQDGTKLAAHWIEKAISETERLYF